MRISISLMPLLFAVSLGGSGCSPTVRANVTDGSGFASLKPAPATQAYIVNHDLPFAKQVLAHNKTCETQAGCKK